MRDEINATFCQTPNLMLVGAAQALVLGDCCPQPMTSKFFKSAGSSCQQGKYRLVTRCHPSDRWQNLSSDGSEDTAAVVVREQLSYGNPKSLP